MDFTLTEEQVLLRATVRDFLARYSTEADVRRLMATPDGHDTAVWKKLAGELGLTGLTIPEEYGGSGASWRELGIVLEEMGRALFCAPYFSTVVLAATALLQSGDQRAMQRYLPKIADGSARATLAFSEDSRTWDVVGVQLTATKTAGGWLLDGLKRFVPDGLVADLIVVAARAPEGVSLFTVMGNTTGLTVTPLPTLDQTRKLADLRFDAVPAEPLGEVGQGWPILERVLDLAAIGQATEQVGGAQAALEMTVEYAKIRIQFGQPIGSFQALKHICADTLLEVESAKSAAYYALAAAADQAADVPAMASLVKALCSDAFVLAAHQNIQLHGGIGFTWEHPAHLYFKRAKATETYLGDPGLHRERLAQRIGL
jgi:alkylation response protein AidB-like acyl-CoA dehydrogenase